MKKVYILAFLVGFITFSYNICSVTATNTYHTFIIYPTETIRLPIHLNSSSGIHGNFIVNNGTVNFALIDPDGIVIFRSYQTDNFTINYSAYKTGIYLLIFSNPSSVQAILVELNYSIKSWHRLIYTFTLQSLIPWWHILLLIITYILEFLIFIGEARKALLGDKYIIIKPIVKCEKPETPIRTYDL